MNKKEFRVQRALGTMEMEMNKCTISIVSDPQHRLWIFLFGEKLSVTIKFNGIFFKFPKYIGTYYYGRCFEGRNTATDILMFNELLDYIEERLND